MPDLIPLPPHDLGAEVSLLGGFLRAGALGAGADITPDEFFDPRNAAVFEVMVELEERAITLAASTVAAELAVRGLLETVGGASFLSMLLGRACDDGQIAHQAEIVRDKATARRLLSRGRLPRERRHVAKL